MPETATTTDACLGFLDQAHNALLQARLALQFARDTAPLSITERIAIAQDVVADQRDAVLEMSSLLEGPA